MGPALFVMAILGCGDGQTACQQVRVVQQRYTSAAECNAAAGRQLVLNADVAYPTIIAQCRREGLLMAEGAAEPQS